MFNKRLPKMLSSYFCNIWPPFFIYLFVYLVFGGLYIGTSLLHDVFWIMHIVNLSLGSYCLFKVRTKITRFHILSILVLLALFLFPGAYLEFPSDSWEHFRRLLEWEPYEQVFYSPRWSKFSYFWGWTFFRHLSPSSRRVAADLYSAFWQLLLAIQFYRLGRKLDFTKGWAAVGVVATICVFGTNVFSFFRYYALSSTLLAYISFLGALILWLEHRYQALPFIVMALVLALLNHRQEFVFFFVLICALEVASFRPKAFKIIMGVSIISGPLLSLLPQFHALYSRFPNYYTSFGLLRLWQPGNSVMETLGLVGLLSALVAFLQFHKHPKISAITLAPIAITMCPLFFYLMDKFSDVYTGYRILYATPPSFILVAFLSNSTLLQNRLKVSYALVALLFLIYGAFPKWPMRGRFWFQVYNVPAMLELRAADDAMDELYRQETFLKRCLLSSEEVTDFLLAVHFQLRTRWTSRPLGPPPNRQIPIPVNLDARVDEHRWCGFITVFNETLPPIPLSIVARLSKHWLENSVKLNWEAPQKFKTVFSFAKEERQREWTYHLLSTHYGLLFETELQRKKRLGDTYIPF